MDCSPPGSSVHGDSPGKNTGVACHALFICFGSSVIPICSCPRLHLRWSFPLNCLFSLLVSPSLMLWILQGPTRLERQLLSTLRLSWPAACLTHFFLFFSLPFSPWWPFPLFSGTFAQLTSLAPISLPSRWHFFSCGHPLWDSFSLYLQMALFQRKKQTSWQNTPLRKLDLSF